MGAFLLAKLTREQKIEIYIKHNAGSILSQLSCEYSINKDTVKYLCRLIDQHGIDILHKNKNRYYSPELKLEIINQVLLEHKSIKSTSIQFGLSSAAILRKWIRSYKENGYVIIEKKRGRFTTMNNKKIPVIKAYEDMTPEEKVRYLEEKNLYLEAENEYLKKLRAVVQERKKRERKKK